MSERTSKSYLLERIAYNAFCNSLTGSYKPCPIMACWDSEPESIRKAFIDMLDDIQCYFLTKDELRILHSHLGGQHIEQALREPDLVDWRITTQ